MNSIQQSQNNFRPLVFVLVIGLIALLLMFYENKRLTGSLPAQDADPIQEFAGKYYMGDGLGVNCSFEISPDSSFKISMVSDGGYKANYNGSISFASGQFILTPKDEVESPEICFHRTFTPVSWGERRYLLPNDDNELSKYIASAFCKSVKNGDEPRNDVHGFSYLRTTDITSKVTGFPKRQDGRLQCPRYGYAQ